jgi:hypothetical protein
MRMVILILSFFIFPARMCPGQHLIGVKKDEISDLVKKEMKGFNQDRSSKNKNYNYLKFLNSAGTKTLFVFFDTSNISTNTRLVNDFSELDYMLEDLNTKYKKTGENIWEYTFDKNKYEITLRKEEWYFVISTKKK